MDDLENNLVIEVILPRSFFHRVLLWFRRRALFLIGVALGIISVIAFVHYLQNGLGLIYNDARLHLDIGRRVVEGLKPGLAQLGSVWLPLTHLLMVATIWNDWMWHSGLAGAIWSMIGYVGTGIVIYLFLVRLDVGMFGRLVGVAIFALNTNVVYLQSTAMTELLLLGAMTTSCYYLLRWFQDGQLIDIIQSAFWIMLSTLVRYDGWFLFAFATGLIFLYLLKRSGYRTAEGVFVLFCTLGGFGIFLWLLWNAAIFKDPFYFAFGPYSAHAQQDLLAKAGQLPTKGSWLMSLKVYFYALAYNTGFFTLLLGTFGALVLWFDRHYARKVRWATLALTAPLFFNILALYLGHSVMYAQGISGETWFNIRYGMMLVPSVAIFVGYLVSRFKRIAPVLAGLLCLVTFFSFASGDAVTVDDGRYGASQKNVTEVASWLRENTANQKGYILIAAATNDAIIFTSGLPMSKFIHEGTGTYWRSATQYPERWARWIVMRTDSNEDGTWQLVSRVPGFANYTLVHSFPFADIYELNSDFLKDLHTEPVLGPQR